MDSQVIYSDIFLQDLDPASSPLGQAIGMRRLTAASWTRNLLATVIWRWAVSNHILHTEPRVSIDLSTHDLDMPARPSHHTGWQHFCQSSYKNSSRNSFVPPHSSNQIFFGTSSHLELQSNLELLPGQQFDRCSPSSSNSDCVCGGFHSTLIHRQIPNIIFGATIFFNLVCVCIKSNHIKQA